MIKREDIKRGEPPRELHRLLPCQVNSLRALLVYKKVAGHPDPGVNLLIHDHADQPERDDILSEDARLFSQRVKQGLES